jgi:ubiquinone/menaquinone biosynthesis C-methylase UbiE
MPTINPNDQTGNPTEISAWEAAYLRFETPQQEIRKFLRRLRSLGANQWPRDSRIVDLFCGRGNGLRALEQMGFVHLEGVDLSPRLLAEYRGSARLHCCDCRHLSFEDATHDIVVVQGGLHHLLELPVDLDQTLREIHRILRPEGILMVVEPWLTPFLRTAHFVARSSLARRLWPKLDAFQVMNENELETYEQWLSQPEVVLERLRTYFQPEQCWFRWGKIMFLGRKK